MIRKLSFKDRQEIEAIILAFDADDKEAIHNEVERIVEGIKSNPIEHALAVFLMGHYGELAITIGQDQMSAQEMAHKFLWDYVTGIEKHSRALDIFERKHGTQEAA